MKNNSFKQLKWDELDLLTINSTYSSVKGCLYW